MTIKNDKDDGEKNDVDDGEQLENEETYILQKQLYNQLNTILNQELNQKLNQQQQQQLIKDYKKHLEFHKLEISSITYNDLKLKVQNLLNIFDLSHNNNYNEDNIDKHNIFRNNQKVQQIFKIMMHLMKN